jgi:hypothetical protein
MNNIRLSIDRARRLLRAALDLSMTFNPQLIYLKIEDCCSGKPDHLSVPDWVREIRLAHHDCLNAELEAGGLPSPGRESTNTIEALALRVRWNLLQDLHVVRHT